MQRIPDNDQGLLLVRSYFRAEILDYFETHYIPDTKQATIAQTVLDCANIAQLYAICKQIQCDLSSDRPGQFRIVGIEQNESTIFVSRASLLLGIEQDGYAHS